MPGKSGTNVNANAQVGKENTQQVVGQQDNTKIEGENVNVSQKENDSSINTSKVDSLVQNNTDQLSAWIKTCSFNLESGNHPY